jgi:hypothetical protein
MSSKSVMQGNPHGGGDEGMIWAKIAGDVLVFTGRDLLQSKRAEGENHQSRGRCLATYLLPWMEWSRPAEDEA